MEKVLNLYKPRGRTPLETLEAFVKTHPEYAKEKMTYAGRLDPMAEGVLLALVGEETKNREAYTSLPKEYVFEWIFGLSTDTYDLLGIVSKKAREPAFAFFENSLRSNSSQNANMVPSPNLLKEYFEKQIGELEQKYPPFSSKVVDGKSLFSLAKAGRLREKDLPSHKVEIKEAQYLGNRSLSKNELLNFIEKTISSVQGNFRQKQILTDWRKNLSESLNEEYIVHKARVVSSSGFYVRQFVFDIGKNFDMPAVTFSIVRTKVGVYNIDKSLRLQ